MVKEVVPVPRASGAMRLALPGRSSVPVPRKGVVVSQPIVPASVVAWLVPTESLATVPVPSSKL